MSSGEREQGQELRQIPIILKNFFLSVELLVKQRKHVLALLCFIYYFM